MKIDWLIQKDRENTIGKKIEEAFEKKPANVYMLLGSLRDSGLEVLENGLIDTKAKVQVIFGFDKKNTTKIMLENLIKYTKDVYGYNNNKEITLDGNIIIFKYKDCATVFTFAGNVSENVLMDNIGAYTHVIYDLSKAEDKEAYKELESKFKSLVKDELVTLIKKDIIAELSDNKEIFTQKIYNHNVKSVAELIAESKAKGSKEEAQEKPKLEDIKYDELDGSLDIDIDLDLGDIDLKEDVSEIKFEMEDIEIPEEEYTSELVEHIVEEENYSRVKEEKEELDFSGEALDLESMVFSAPSVKMKKESIKKIKEEDKKEDEEETAEDDLGLDEEEVKLISKKINLKNVSTLVMQLPKQLKRGKEKDSIKIPNYVRQLIPNFIDMSNAESYKIDNEVVKSKTIKLDMLNIDNNIKYEDSNAMITVKVGQTYTSMVSENFSNVDIEENSIARILKLEDDAYSIEIIPTTSSEYSIWKKVCNLSLRGSNRKYGVM